MEIGQKTLDLKRNEFKRACNFRGRVARYYKPLDEYNNTLWNEWHHGHKLFKDPIETRILWHEHLNEWTLKRLGMIQVLNTDHAIIECPHMIEVVQGGVFTVRSGINKDEWLPYRVALLRTVDENVISITAELAPIYKGTETDGNRDTFFSACARDDDN
jgi:hypothetical protein